MKYKQQIQNKTEAVSNTLETLERGLQANAISKGEAISLIAKLKTLISDISNLTDLEN
tara:strand:+ start:83 stop:256 length:174 start_codon:yes stop_codon:yes gene_type:complete